MIVHIMPQSTFTEGFMRFNCKCFNADIRYILVGNNTLGNNIKSTEYVIAIKSPKEIITNKLCRKVLRESDSVIINYVDYKIALLTNIYKNKTSLLFWGADIDNLRKEPITIKNGFLNLIKKRIVSNVSSIITLMEGDYKKIRSLVHPKGKWYLGSIWTDELLNSETKCNLKKDTSGKKRILLGNSATVTNRHIEALSMLSKFSSEDVEIYCPLSYGDKEYAEVVIEHGKKLFDHSFIPLIDFMDRSSYEDFLSSIDIGIFNNSRQQGLGNIYALLNKGTKVYISKSSLMINDLHNEGFVVYETEDIVNLDYNTFINNPSINIDKNKAAGDYEKRRNRAKSQWQKIYEELDVNFGLKA